MNFTKNTIEKLHNINIKLIDKSKMPVKILQKFELKKAFQYAKIRNENLLWEFEKYGNNEDQIVSGMFYDEYSKDVKHYTVKKVLTIEQIFAFDLCKDNFLTYQQTLSFLESIK